MELTSPLTWDVKLADPSGQREPKPRTAGKTMVIDKGLGLRGFEDLLDTSSHHIDIIKLGFGTSPLYPKEVLQKKIGLARAHDICIMPGGTFLEAAVHQQAVDHFFKMIDLLGFSGIEVSDGTIELERGLRNQLILKGIQHGLTVFTEYGKKCWGSSIEIEELINTIHEDMEFGSSMVTVEGRESGIGVGIYDEKGECKDEEIAKVLEKLPNPHVIMWETPLKSQQVHFIKMLGADINLGNIAPDDIISLEALRRGLRSDTFF